MSYFAVHDIASCQQIGNKLYVGKQFSEYTEVGISNEEGRYGTY
jgi:hypothetical protein